MASDDRCEVTNIAAVSQPPAVGIDVGATKINAGLIDTTGQILGRQALKITPSGDASGLVRPLVELIEEFRRTEPKLTAVGVGTAGLVRWPEGEVGFAGNHAHRKLKLRARLAERCGLDVVVDNDANAAALSEVDSYRDEAVLFVAVGTGLGSGFLVGGKVFRWLGGPGTELGHVVVEPVSGVKCSCGVVGCLETVASGRALSRLGLAAIKANPRGQLARFLDGTPVSTRSMIRAAQTGIQEACAIVDRMGESIGTAIGRYMFSLLPVNRVVVGGGLAVLGDMLTMPIHRGCRRVIGTSRFLSVPIVSRSAHGHDAVMIGAGRLAHAQFGLSDAEAAYSPLVRV